MGKESQSQLNHSSLPENHGHGTALATLALALVIVEWKNVC